MNRLARSDVLYAGIVAVVVLLVIISSTFFSAPVTDKRSGPISTFPQNWAMCGVQSTLTNVTTTGTDSLGYLANILTHRGENLTYVYRAITTSPDFVIHTQNLGWVVIDWSGLEVTGLNESYLFIDGGFVLTKGGVPSGYIQADYDLFTGDVSIIGPLVKLPCMG
jgi:hypothetical protein